jgi:hypothetical protein
MRRPLVLALLVVLVAVSTVAPATGAAIQSDNSSESDSRYTLEELRQPGRQLDNAPASVRLAQHPGLLVWMQYVPAGAATNSQDREAAKFVTPDTTVERNEVMLRANLVEIPAGARNMTATVVAYHVGTHNGTKRPENVTVRQQQVSFSRGFAQVPVDLPQVDGEAKRVTVWLQTKDGATVATWRFKHRSAATTQAVPPGATNDLGSLVAWALLNVGLYIGIGALVGVILGVAAVKRAITGPGSAGLGTLLVWLIPAGLVGGMVYFGIVELFVTQPALFALPSAAAMFIVTVVLSPGSDPEKSLFVRPRYEEVDQSPAGGEDAADFATAKTETLKLANTDRGKAVIRPGWLPFLARIYGGVAVVENWDEATALVRCPDSAHAALHILRPTPAEDHEADLIPFDPPTLTASLPDSWPAVAWRAAVVAVLGLVGYQMYPGTSVTLGVASAGATALLVSLDGKPGSAYIPWGSRHHRRAWATAQKFAEEVDAADSAEQAEQKRLKQRAREERKSREKAAARESAFLGEILGVKPPMDEAVDAARSDASSVAEIAAAVDAGDLSAEEGLTLLENGHADDEEGSDD